MMIMIVVVQAIPRVNWPFNAFVSMFTIVRVIKVKVTLTVFMLVVSTRNWPLTVPMVIIRILALTKLFYL